jgi:hypothetical protein
MTHPTFAAEKHRNSLHRCNAPGCAWDRRGLSQFCRSHAETTARYGEPTGTPIDPKRWALYRQQVQEVFQVNHDHPGLVNALQFIREWMAQAVEDGRAFPGAEELKRLMLSGVSPMEVLLEVSAFYAFSQACPHTCRTDKGWDYAMSRAVFRLAPRPRRRTRKGTYAPQPRASALGHIGKHLRQVLAGFLANVQLALEAREDAKRAAMEAWRQPLRQPVTALINEALQASQNSP